MKIEDAVLGLLSWKPFSGYDIKKIMQESPFMYWSGNNNQIYRALLELLSHGYVKNETTHQDGGPSKKIYTITEEGRKELERQTVSSEPEAPEFRKSFLIQLFWAGALSEAELDELLSKYIEELRQQVLLRKEEVRRASYFPVDGRQNRFIWEMICENLILSLEQELSWAERLRAGVRDLRETDRTKGLVGEERKG